MNNGAALRRSTVKGVKLLLALTSFVAVALAPAAVASAATTERVSVDGAGNQADSASYAPAVSADGRYVAFISAASNLVPDDTNGQSDVFVYDRQTGAIERVSVDSAGNQADGGTPYSGNGPSVAISADGRYVAFGSRATNLVPNDTNGQDDVFVHDLQTGTTERVSVDSSGNQSNDVEYGPPAVAISGDGRYVAFSSFKSDLVPNDTNGSPCCSADIFVHDRQTGTTERVSVDSSGNQADPGGLGGGASSGYPAISADGRYVAFYSVASNLVPNDTNGTADAFVHDRQTGATERVSVDSAGNEGNDASGVTTAISADGRFVAFGSAASNLVPADTNGQLDIFVHDLQTGTTERVSVDSAGAEGNGESIGPAISADGRFVAFGSWASNLVPGDTNDSCTTGGPDPSIINCKDAFVHDRQTGTTELVSVDSAGNQGNNASPSLVSDIEEPAMSADGRYVAFSSQATNLVPGDTNDTLDVFVRDRATTAVNSTSEEAPAGGTVATNSTTSAADPVGTALTTPNAGTVTIDEGSTTTPDPSGYSLLGDEVQISAPSATPASPLVIQFLLDPSILPAGTDAATVQVFRNGVAIADCDPGSGGSATPDPCISDRASTTGGGIAITVRTSEASTWNFGLHTAYAFQGFLSPIAAPPSLNPAQAGSTVTLRFKLGGNQGLGILASGYPRSHKISCDSAATDLGDDAQTAGTLSYDTRSQRYSYAWKTSKAWAKPASCRQFVLRLNDGSSHRANFKFGK